MDNEQIKKYSYDVVVVYMTNIVKSGGYYNYLHGNYREEQIRIPAEQNGSLSPL